MTSVPEPKLDLANDRWSFEKTNLTFVVKSEIDAAIVCRVPHNTPDFTPQEATEIVKAIVAVPDMIAALAWIKDRLEDGTVVIEPNSLVANRITDALAKGGVS